MGNTQSNLDMDKIKKTILDLQVTPSNEFEFYIKLSIYEKKYLRFFCNETLWDLSIADHCNGDSYLPKTHMRNCETIQGKSNMLKIDRGQGLALLIIPSQKAYMKLIYGDTYCIEAVEFVRYKAINRLMSHIEPFLSTGYDLLVVDHNGNITSFCEKHDDRDGYFVRWSPPNYKKENMVVYEKHLEL